MNEGTLADRLNPGRVRTSPKFTAVLAFLLDERWTDPAIAEMHILSDGVLVVRHEDELGMDHILGEAADLDANLRGLASTCALSPEDTQALLDRVTTHVTDWRSASRTEDLIGYVGDDDE